MEQELGCYLIRIDPPEIPALKYQNKIDLCLYQIVLLLARKNLGLIKIRNLLGY